MQHQSLDNGRWAEMTLAQQMSNIGSETSRIYKALIAGKEERAEKAFVRFQELIDLTIKYGRANSSPLLRSSLLEELCRLRELYCQSFTQRESANLLSFNKYFDHFATVAR